jgi:hypothetical protein
LVVSEQVELLAVVVVVDIMAAAADPGHLVVEVPPTQMQ